MIVRINDLVVSDKVTIRDALLSIDRSAMGIAFVVNGEGVLAGTITDGNIRRALIGGTTLTDSVMKATTTACVSLPVTATIQEINDRLNTKIHVIPLLDQLGRPVDYASHFRGHRIPVMSPTLTGNELAYVVECVKTNWISSQGAFVKRFESDFSAYIGVPGAITVSNGTTALHLALAALGVGPGDEVIVPDLTFAATINAVLYVGATPVLADVTKDTWTIDPAEMKKLITPRTKAVIPVHLYGQPAEMEEIGAIAGKYNLLIIEDAAEALGSLYHGAPVGSMGDAAIFSFFGNKLITTGEGGMVVFRDAAACARARKLRDHGMEPNRRYWHTEIGYNYRLTNLQAAIGVAQLEQIEKFIVRKMEIADSYRKHLSAIKEISQPLIRNDVRNVYWLYSIVLENKDGHIVRDRLISQLLLKGVETRPLFYPLHIMPLYAKYGQGREFPNADWLGLQGLSLPSAVDLTDDEVGYVCRCMTTLLKLQE